MLPSAISLQNYRSFPDETVLELAPITLLFGVNNSGKSALLRALPLLCDSTSPSTEGPLDLASEALCGGGFTDLRWRGAPREDAERDIGVSLRWDAASGPSSVDYSLHWFDPWRRIICKRVRWRTPDGDESALEWVQDEQDQRRPDLLYRMNASRETIRVTFEGLIPRSDSRSPGAEWLERQITTFRDSVQWLRPIRRADSRGVRLTGQMPSRLQPDGSNAALVVEASPDILSDVSSWYERTIGRRLSVTYPTTSTVNVYLEPVEQLGFNMNVTLSESGEGIQQVFPILVAMGMATHAREGRSPILMIEEPEASLHPQGQRALMEKFHPQGQRALMERIEMATYARDHRSTILVIEEPESHLNPRLQRALAEKIVAVAATEKAPPRVVLETHSPHFLAAVQIEVARGHIPPEHVRLYWVEQDARGRSTTRKVTLDSKGRPDDAWPYGVFSDLTEMSRELFELRRD